MAKKETENKKSTKSTTISVKKAKKENVSKVAKSSKTTKKPSNTKSTTKSIKKAQSSSKVAKKSSNTKSVKKVPSTTKVARKTSSSRKISTKKQMLSEYYDLPYGYNQTTVKILAQTPTTLFVYWDISEEDRNNLIKLHGENFFYETKPILIVHNTTKNYSFEIEINDFANSWYIRCQEPNCDYVIELGRKIIQKPDEYIYIDSSNDIISPNNHILFENIDLGNVLYRNVKTGVLSSKDYGSLRFINDIDKLYGNIYDIYDKLYKYNSLNDISNPSSGEFILR